MQPHCAFFAFISTGILNPANHYSCPLALHVAPARHLPTVPTLRNHLLWSDWAEPLGSFLTWRVTCSQMTRSEAKERGQVRAHCSDSWAPIRADLGFQGDCVLANPKSGRCVPTPNCLFPSTLELLPP